MTTKRIRCSCGRVYDPVKRPACPDCGTVNAVVAAATTPAEPEPQVKKRAPVDDPIPPLPPPRPLPIPPRTIAIGAGAVVLLVLVIALSRCGSPKPASTPTPTATPVTSPVSSASPLPTATPAASSSPRIEVAPSIAPTPYGIPESFDLTAAIAAAAPGATIKVPPGSYPGGLIVNKAVRLVGTLGQVFIQSEGRECLSVRAAGVAVQNVQFICNGIGELPAISVATGADLSLEACKVQSNTALGVSATGAIKALGSSFTAANGSAVRLNSGSRSSFTQCSLGESIFGLWLTKGATAELHSCAFDRNGGEGKGGIASLSAAPASLTAEDCHFTNNTAGIRALDGATLTISGSSFKENGITPREGAMLGLVVLFNGAKGSIANSTFESNKQGVAAINGSKLQVDKCQFSGNGVQGTEILFCQPIGVDGKDAVVTVRNSVLTDSAQYSANALDGGTIIIEDTEISGSRGPGLVVGYRGEGPGRAEVKRCRFLHNLTGVGLVAGSTVAIEDSEFRENQDGIIALDRKTNLRGTRLKFTGNTDSGLFLRQNAEAFVTDSDFMNNARGATAGVGGKPAERASFALENCRFGGSRFFAVGACTQSQVSLTNCSFDGTDKQNIYKERGAIVKNDTSLPSPGPTAAADASPSPTSGAGVAPKPVPEPEAGDGTESSATPSHSPSRPRPTPKRRILRPEEEAARILRRILPHP